MLVKVAIPKQIQFKIVPNLPEMLFGKQQEIHYIGGSEVLPPPLEPEEENAAIEQLDSGYEQEARTLLIEHNLRLVVYIAKKFDNTGVGVEDLISIGTIGLIKAINTFNKDKNINELILVDGRFPLNNNECVIDSSKKHNHKIGDEITVVNENLIETKLTIVGTVKTPLFISLERGTTDLLTGNINYFIYSLS